MRSSLLDRSEVAQAGAASEYPRGRRQIALISPWYPEPADNGSKVRLRQLIDTFAQDYDVVLIALLTPAQRAATSLPAVSGVARTIVMPLPDYRPGSLRGLAAGLHPLPRSFTATWDQRTADAVKRLVQSARIDLVVGTDLRIVRYLVATDLDVPVVLDEANVSPFVVAGRGRRHLRELLRERKYQRLLHSGRALNAVVVPSAPEADAYRTLSPLTAVHVVANGVDRFPSPWTPPGSTGMLYTGSLTYEPNLEAVTWYERAILPLLRTQMACPVLHVTGALPDTIPDVLKQPAFRLTGRVDDLDPLFRASGVFIAPILSGTGTRIKILEALAFGIPVVTTSKGCEGVRLVSGRHALVADTPEAFALAILRVLRDPTFAQQLGASGRAFVAQHYSWSNSAEQFRAIVADLLKQEC